MNYVEPVMRSNFLEYASYVIIDRAIPDLRDGCKPVQRRILQTLHEMDDGRFHKVANVIGETMKLHPHGDASIGDALVVLANKDYFIEKQGNFGNILTGHPAAAARYIECRLTPLARETLFNPDLTTWKPSYDGRKKEPLFLPAKIPVLLMLGTEGIAVGMSTRILPHNLGELLEAQIAILEKRPFDVLPDFPQGGLADFSDYDDGAGKVRVRARLRATRDRKKIIIEEVPFSTTTESLIASIEAAAQKNKVAVASIEDRTAEQVQIVLHLRRGSYSDEVIPQLWAYTHCEVSITSNLVVIDQRRPVERRVSELLIQLTDNLKRQIKAELELEIERLLDRQHALTLEQIFVEKRVYKRIEEARTQKAVRDQVLEGMNEYRDLFIRDLDDDDVTRLLAIPIRRISLFDINKNRADIDEVIAGLRSARRRLKNLTRTTIDYLRGLIDRFAADHPRRTEITSFATVDKREVAAQNLKLAYNPDSGFFGSEVRGKKWQITASEFDRILAVSADGSYRIFAPPQKKLLPGRVLLICTFDSEKGQVLTVVYRDKEKYPFAKKVQIKGYIKDKEYELIRGRQGRIDKLFIGEVDAKLHLEFVPAKRQRVHETTFDLSTLDFCGITARGTRMATKPTAKIRLL